VAAGLFTTAADQLGGPLHVIPIPLAAPMYHAYYGQISNEILWMLQHRILGAGGFDAIDAARHRAWSQGYLQANARLAAEIQRHSGARAFLLQDYHLYPLPALLRSAFPSTPILHFTHIPFPDPPLMKLLPREWRETILRGLLGADIVGVQTRADVEAFVSCCDAFLGCSVHHRDPAVRAEDGRWVSVRPYPASVEPAEIEHTMRSEAVETARVRLHDQLGDFNIVRVDRVDPSKNQPLGFQAFGRLLELRPDLRGRVRFSAFLVPSRTDLQVYRAYKDSIYATVDAINRRFASNDGREPISVFYTNDRAQALAAMEVCDALLVNSLQDGMNLVAKEWALVSNRPGALILSETAGVSAEAANAALLISPLDVEGTAAAMGAALDMTMAERAQRLARFSSVVRQWTAGDWLSAQLADLGVSSLPVSAGTAG